MQPKVLIVVLVVLAVLLAAAIAVGGAGDRSQGGTLKDAVGAWAVRVLGKTHKEQALSAQDVQAAFPEACRQQLAGGAFVLPEGSACTLTIGRSSAPVRTLSLRLAQGTSAGVHLELFGKEQLKADQELKQGQDGDTIDAQFLEDGGTLTLRCTNGGAGPGSACRLEVAPPAD
jgi:hypothetical protein